MKIVLLGDSLATQNAGIHFYGRQLVQKIADHYRAHELYIVLPWHLEGLSVLGLTTIIVPLRSSIPFHLRIRQLIHIPRKLRHIAPDVVIELAHFGPFGLPAATKRITVIHDLTPIHHPHLHTRLSVSMHRRLLPGIMKRADFLFTNSEATKAEIIADYPQTEGRVTVIYPDVVEPTAQQPSGMPKPHWPYFLSVGTMEPRKNLHVILSAFEIYCTKQPTTSTQLILTGPRGWKNDRFLQKLKISPVRDRIILMGRVERSDLWSLYRGALALVSASIAEGFGLPLLEAMSLDVPLILSDIPVYREVGGNHALFFPPQDSEALAKHLEQITAGDTSLAAWRKRSHDQYLKLISVTPAWPLLS